MTGAPHKKGPRVLSGEALRVSQSYWQRVTSTRLIPVGEAMVPCSWPRPQDPSLPFVGMAEVLVLAAARRSNIPTQRAGPALDELQRRMGVAHALAPRRLCTDGRIFCTTTAKRAARPVLRPAGLPDFLFDRSLATTRPQRCSRWYIEIRAGSQPRLHEELLKKLRNTYEDL